jgi:hypothetical protein
VRDRPCILTHANPYFSWTWHTSPRFLVNSHLFYYFFKILFYFILFVIFAMKKNLNLILKLLFILKIVLQNFMSVKGFFQLL